MGHPSIVRRSMAEEVKQNLPKKAICASMCIGPEGDLHDVSAGECAVRMAKAGANVVGVNCHFDPYASLDTMQIMKDALEDANLLNKGSPKVGKGKQAPPSHVNRKVYLMCQPLAFHTPDAGRQGFIDLPEFPFALEPRICTRWDMHKPRPRCIATRWVSYATAPRSPPSVARPPLSIT